MVGKVTLTKKDNSQLFLQGIKDLGRSQVLVGIPENDHRQERLQRRIDRASTRNKKNLIKRQQEKVSNAELLFIFSFGSPASNIPPRPVIEPAIVADGNREPITEDLGAAAKATLEGKKSEALRNLKRAGMEGQNAARGWFTDSRNHWAPNADSTIAAKGSDRPGINTGEMRKAITYVTVQDSNVEAHYPEEE